MGLIFERKKNHIVVNMHLFFQMVFSFFVAIGEEKMSELLYLNINPLFCKVRLLLLPSYLVCLNNMYLEFKVYILF